jgi:hypothetical protein
MMSKEIQTKDGTGWFLYNDDGTKVSMSKEMEERSLWFLYNDDGTKTWFQDWSIALPLSQLWCLGTDENGKRIWYYGWDRITEEELYLKYRYKIYYSDFDLNVFSDIVYGDYKGLLEHAPISPEEGCYPY